MKRNFCLLAITIIAVLSGCKDDGPIMVDPPFENRFFPLDTNSFSEFRTVLLDENNVEIAASEENEMRTWGAPGTFFGASGRPEFTEYSDGTIDTGYVSNVNNMAHWWSEPFELPGLSPNIMVERWMKMADFSMVSGWTMLNDSLKGLQFLADTNWRFNGKVTKTALKGAMMNVNYGDNISVSAQEFTYSTLFDGTVVLDTNGNTEPLQFTLNERAYFAENLGLVRYERDFKTVEFQSVNYPVYGYRVALLRRGEK
jgi:hypothetical protein